MQITISTNGNAIKAKHRSKKRFKKNIYITIFHRLQIITQKTISKKKKQKFYSQFNKISPSRTISHDAL